MTNSTDDFPIDPADAARARELTTFDPVYGTPSPVQVVGDVRLPKQLKATALPPEARAKVEAELAGVPFERRTEVEGRLVEKYLYQNSFELRAKAGLGEDATPVQRTAFATTRELHDLDMEAYNISAQLGEVARWDNVVDPATGKVMPLAIERIQGERRKALEARLREIDHHKHQLNTVEGERRHKQAVKETLDAEKRTRQALEERAEAIRRADESAREDRINAAAASRARFLGPTNL